MDKTIPLLKTLILPVSVLLLALVAYSKGLLAGVSPQITAFSVWLLLIVSLALSIGFKKSRFFLITLVLILNHLFQTCYPGAKALQPLLMAVIPFNLFIFAAVSERQVNGSGTRIAIVWLLLQLLTIYGYIDKHQIDLSQVYAEGLPFLISQGWSWLLLIIYLIILTILNLIRLNRSYGAMVGIILTVWCGLLLTGSSGVWLLFSLAAAILVTAVIVTEIYRLAFLDELTSLYSRRCFNLDLVHLSGTYTIAMVDIDHFKKINDTYGHDVGDQVLRYITSFMRKTPRGTKAYRYGGEEFALIFKGLSKNEAVPYLEELRKTMAKRPFTLRAKDRPEKKPPSAAARTRSVSNNQINITVSIGVADNSRRSFRPSDVVVSADKALYQAKKNGRNRTCVFN